ncbi:MAG: Flp family type IVb pilin [Rhodospirillales bacterium]
MAINSHGLQDGVRCRQAWKAEKTIGLASKFLRDESGASAIGHGLIAAPISVAATAALQAMGGSLTKIDNAAKTALSGAAGRTIAAPADAAFDFAGSPIAASTLDPTPATHDADQPGDRARRPDGFSMPGRGSPGPDKYMK